MSRLEELIAEYCPDGVEYVRLGDLCSIVTKQTGFDYSNHIKPSLLSEKSEGALPYIQTKFFSGKSFDYETDYYVPKIIADRFPKITLDQKCLLFSIVGASIGNVGLFPGHTVCFLGGAICVAKVKPEYNVDYLFYCVESNHVQYQISRKTKGAGQATVTVEDIREFTIPFPPLPVQREIVSILDSFTERIVELKEKLTAELTARKKQYEYYKEQVLNCDAVGGSLTLDECTETVSNIKWKETKEEKRYIDLSSVDKETKAIGQTVVIDRSNAPSRAQQIVRGGDILFATTRPMQRRFCYVPMEYDNQIASTGYCVLRAKKSIVLPKWIYYAISIDSFYRYIEPLQVQGNYPSITNKNVRGYQIHVPPISEQEKIIQTLDSFESLCNDISSGLPAEIEARQKQYEYYRDKLLTFKEKQ